MACKLFAFVDVRRHYFMSFFLSLFSFSPLPPFSFSLLDPNLLPASLISISTPGSAACECHSEETHQPATCVIRLCSFLCSPRLLAPPFSMKTVVASELSRARPLQSHGALKAASVHPAVAVSPRGGAARALPTRRLAPSILAPTMCAWTWHMGVVITGTQTCADNLLYYLC